MTFLYFLNSVRKHLWALMSCAIFTLISLYAAYRNENNEWIVRLTLIAAAVCLFLACFLAWKEEHVSRLKYEDEMPSLGLGVHGVEGPKAWNSALVPVAFTLALLRGRVPTNICFEPIPSGLGKYQLQFDELAFIQGPHEIGVAFEIIEVGAHKFSAKDRETLRVVAKDMLEYFLNDCEAFTGDLEFPVTAHFNDLNDSRTQKFSLTFETGKYRFSPNSSPKPIQN